MGVIIRKAGVEDFFTTENLTREAFWNLYKPGCDEHLVLHNIRKSDGYLSDLDLIAIHENEIAGHIISTRARVVDEQDREHEVLCIGPVSVLPRFQKKGIGTKLMDHAISSARTSGYKGMILFGNPDYYHRFGFRNAKEYAITTRDHKNFEPFMALELQDGGLSGVSGRFFEDDAYTIQQEELVEFEKKFPYKEKLKTATQFRQ